MPVKQRIRHTANPIDKRKGLIQGSKPHRRHNAHRVNTKWPYIRAIFLWFVCLALLFMAIATAGFGVFAKDMKFIKLGMILAAAWFIFKVIYMLASKSTTCPLCRAPHLVNGKSNKHKKAYKIFPFTYATTAVLTATTSMCIRCMHCGVTFDLNKKRQ